MLKDMCGVSGAVYDCMSCVLCVMCVSHETVDTSVIALIHIAHRRVSDNDAQKAHIPHTCETQIP